MRKLLLPLLMALGIVAFFGTGAQEATANTGPQERSPYEVVRLNDGEPIIDASMFADPDEGENINGPSLIRVPDWIHPRDRPHRDANYYLYFAHHRDIDGYVRMAWAENIEGPYTLHDDHGRIGDRGVLDYGSGQLDLGNFNITVDHIASPDVIVDHENQRIVMYMHISGQPFNANGVEFPGQRTFVATNDTGLDFDEDDIEDISLGTSYFRVFEYENRWYSVGNTGVIQRAPNATDPWDVTDPNFNLRNSLWETQPQNPFAHWEQRDGARARHFGTRVVGDELHLFYSRRAEYGERIMFSTIDLTKNWTNWTPSDPPREVLAANPGWEGGDLAIRPVEQRSFGQSIREDNELRDPDIFEDTDGSLYLLYSGRGEGGIGIARLYEAPGTDTLTPVADAHVRQNSPNNNYSQESHHLTVDNSASDTRTAYITFDLSQYSDIEHAVLRLYSVTNGDGGAVTVHETPSNWNESSITWNNAPAVGDPIFTNYVLKSNQYHEFNVSDYLAQNPGGEVSFAVTIPLLDDFKHRLGNRESGNAPELLVAGSLDRNAPAPAPAPTPAPAPAPAPAPVPGNGPACTVTFNNSGAVLNWIATDDRTQIRRDGSRIGVATRLGTYTDPGGTAGNDYLLRIRVDGADNVDFPCTPA